jgi:hypothetical protein
LFYITVPDPTDAHTYFTTTSSSKDHPTKDTPEIKASRLACSLFLFSFHLVCLFGSSCLLNTRWYTMSIIRVIIMCILHYYSISNSYNFYRIH